MLNHSKLTEKGQGFRFANSGGISDTTLLSIANQFRTQTSRSYKITPAKALPKLYQPTETAHASIKYDGEGVFVYYEREKDLCFAFNAPSGRVRIGLPCLRETKALLDKADIRKALLVAELYLKSPTQARTRVSDVIHITSQGTPQERENLSLAFYDAIMIDGKDLRENQTKFLKTLEILQNLFPTQTEKKAHVAEGQILTGNELQHFFTEVTQNRGLEGIVVRALNNNTIHKIKPNLSIDTVIIGYVEGEFENKYGVLSLLCALTSPDNKTLQTLCRVGSGFSDEQRENLLPRLQSLRCSNPLPLTDSEGRPILLIKPNLVAEIEGEAIYSETLSGEPLLNQTFLWTGEEYKFQGLKPSAQISHPTFSQLREDKTWDNGGTRMSQAFSEKIIESILDQTPEKQTSPKIFLREVYQKENKGKTAVRKIVVVERTQTGYHPYSIHYTDFSDGRAEPLKSETQVANTEERLHHLLDLLKTETIKKGWTKL